MAHRRVVLELLARAERAGTRESLIGDLLEETARGRSEFWLWQQLVGVYGCVVTSYFRTQARLTPLLVVVALGVVLLSAVSVAPLSRVLVTWFYFYLVAGTLSLFGHMAAHTTYFRARMTPVDVDECRAG